MSNKNNNNDPFASRTLFWSFMIIIAATLVAMIVYTDSSSEIKAQVYQEAETLQQIR